MDVEIDPVCGMNVSGVTDAETLAHDGRYIRFCGDLCKEKFKTHPQKFQGIPLITLSDVQKKFRIGDTETQVLRGVYLHIWEGDFVAIIGASGSGKSTALNMIGLLDTPTSGNILLNNKDVSSLGDDERAALRSKKFGFVFQQYNLIPWLSAEENVSLPMIFANREIASKRIESDFKKIGLHQRRLHRPMELSGGEQQRVALLRALVNNPDIIIGDEPTGNLDSATGNAILEMLIDLNKSQGKTLIIVTHDADIAEKADHIIVIKDGVIVRDHGVHKKVYTE